MGNLLQAPAGTPASGFRAACRFPNARWRECADRGLPRLEKSGGVGTDANVPCVPSSTFWRGILGHQGAVVAGKQHGNRIRAAAMLCVAISVPMRKSRSWRNACSGKVDVLNDVVQGYMRVRIRRLEQVPAWKGRQMRPPAFPASQR